MRYRKQIFITIPLFFIFSLVPMPSSATTFASKSGYVISHEKGPDDQSEIRRFQDISNQVRVEITSSFFNLEWRSPQVAEISTLKIQWPNRSDLPIDFKIVNEHHAVTYKEIEVVGNQNGAFVHSCQGCSDTMVNCFNKQIRSGISFMNRHIDPDQMKKQEDFIRTLLTDFQVRPEMIDEVIQHYIGITRDEAIKAYLEKAWNANGYTFDDTSRFAHRYSKDIRKVSDQNIYLLLKEIFPENAESILESYISNTRHLRYLRERQKIHSQLADIKFDKIQLLGLEPSVPLDEPLLVSYLEHVIGAENEYDRNKSETLIRQIILDDQVDLPALAENMDLLKLIAHLSKVSTEYQNLLEKNLAVENQAQTLELKTDSIFTVGSELHYESSIEGLVSILNRIRDIHVAINQIKSMP